MIKMSVEMYYRIRKHDPDGVLVSDTGLIPSHSYVIQFLEMIEGLFSGEDVTVTDIAGAESVLIDASDAISGYLYAKGGVGNDTWSIVVGTNAGTTAEDNLNYQLDTKILHSAVGAAGKLNYQVSFGVAARVVGPNVDMDIVRPFINETAGTITVKEIGLNIRNITDTKYHLLVRDVVSDEAVLAGHTLTVTYTLRTTV